MYSTAFAALDDPAFRQAYTNNEEEYILPTKYINQAFVFAKSLFSQAISSHTSIDKEAMPRKANSLLNAITKWYDTGKVFEGFVPQGDFKNYVYEGLRSDIPDLIDLLVDKGWLYLTRHSDQKRKLNGGFPNKLVDTGDFIYHLNKDGIRNYKMTCTADQIKGLHGRLQDL